MKLKINTANSTTVIMQDGTEVLFSYETPVAAFIPGKGYVRTSEQFSATTTKHIRAYCGKCEELPQDYFNQLLEKV